LLRRLNFRCAGFRFFNAMAFDVSLLCFRCAAFALRWLAFRCASFRVFAAMVSASLAAVAAPACLCLSLRWLSAALAFRCADFPLRWLLQFRCAASAPH
jgi:hypothetical protein